MEEKQLDSNTVSKSSESLETKSKSSPKKTDTSPSHNSGAIPKTGGRSKSGGVKLGSFRLGGKKKAITESGDSSLELKDEKRSSKKIKKSKVKDIEKPEAEQMESGSESPSRLSKPSKATSLVRKLSIGKHKTTGSGHAKYHKTQEGISSQEDSPVVSKTDISTEDDRFSTASSSTSVATGGRPSLEQDDVTPTTLTSNPQPEEVTNVDNQSTSSSPATDTKVNKSECSSIGSRGEHGEGGTVEKHTMEIGIESSITQEDKTSGVTKSIADQSTQDSNSLPGLAKQEESVDSDTATVTTEYLSAQSSSDQSDVSTLRSPSPPLEKLSSYELWLASNIDGQEDNVLGLMPDVEDKQSTTKDQILQITAPVLQKQQEQGVNAAEKKLSLGMAAGKSSTADTNPGLSQSLDSSAQQVGEKREHLYKILVIGELGTGKTSIIKRYVHQFFSQHYRATIGVDFALKVLNWDANTIIRLQLWDIAGQERFGNMTRVYYKEAVGAFIVFDVTRTATFEAVVKWKQDLDSKVQLPDGSPIPCVLLANKCDQQKEGLVNNHSKMDEYAREKGFSGWYETSAKENINIEEAARSLVTKILQNDRQIHRSESAKDMERFALDGRNHKNTNKSKCSC